MSRNNQYIFAGILAIYIVFFTRPAPSVVANMLSSPIAQLAVLGGVVYIGASVSLLVAIVAAIAVVLSMPVREHLVDTPPSASSSDSSTSAIDSVKPSDKKKDDKKDDKKKDEKKKDEHKKDDKKKDDKKKDEKKKDDPIPAGDAAVIADKKDHFTLQYAAPF